MAEKPKSGSKSLDRGGGDGRRRGRRGRRGDRFVYLG
jgi:hypothetical protein